MDGGCGREEIVLGVCAILLTTWVLPPWIGGRGLGVLLGAGEMPRQASAGLKPVGTSAPASGYMAVVLLPPPIKQKKEIVAPRVTDGPVCDERGEAAGDSV